MLWISMTWRVGRGIEFVASARKSVARGGRTVLVSFVGVIPNTWALLVVEPLTLPYPFEKVPHAWPLDQACP